MPPAIRTILTLGIIILPVAIDSNRLHNGTTKVRRVRPVVGYHRQIYKDGLFRPAAGKQENGSGSGCYICMGNMVTPRTPSRHRFGLGFEVYLRNLEGVPPAQWNSAMYVNSFPPPNG